MTSLLRKGRAWLGVVKSGVLLVLPGPLFLTALVDLASGRGAELALSGGGIACFWAAAALAASGLAAEARYHLGERLDPPRVPLKLASLVCTTLGTALAATSGDYSPLVTAVFAALAVNEVRERERKTMEFYKSARFTLADAKAGKGY